MTFIIIIGLLFLVLLLIAFLVNQFDEDLPKSSRRSIDCFEINKNIGV